MNSCVCTLTNQCVYNQKFCVQSVKFLITFFFLFFSESYQHNKNLGSPSISTVNWMVIENNENYDVKTLNTAIFLPFGLFIFSVKHFFFI